MSKMYPGPWRLVLVMNHSKLKEFIEMCNDYKGEDAT